MPLDVQSAIVAHSQWKTRLKAYLQKPDGSIDVKLLARSDACALGKWIETEAGRSLGPAELKALRDAHAAFHLAAADVARRATAGAQVQAEVGLGANSPFSKASSEVVQRLTRLAS